jgi:hypothetical protein
VPRLIERLDSESYQETVRRVDELDEEPYRSFRAARRQVMAATGLGRVRVWIKYRILEPRFDSVASWMPKLGLTDDEATALADFLVADFVPPQTTTMGRVRQALDRFLPARPGKRHLLLFFAVGFGTGAGLTITLRFAARLGARARARRLRQP